MGSETQSAVTLPKIDFSGLGPASHGSEAWAAARSQVMEALATYGCFEAAFPKVTPELRSTMFRNSMKELFALPVETKVKNTSNKPFHAYLGPNPYTPHYESLAVMDVLRPQGLQSFTGLMWPQGNPDFSESVRGFSETLAELDRMVMRMVFESVGAEEFCDSILDVSKYSLRMSEYKAPMTDGEKNLGLIPHRDKNTTAIVCQDQVDGLEMESKDGVWYPATPSSDSVIMIAGDALQAWTNGRVYSPLHRIMVGGKVTRYSTIFFSIPNDDVVIQAPAELIDEADHPQLYKPYEYGSYINFCFSEEGRMANPQLEAFCGLRKPATTQV